MRSDWEISKLDPNWVTGFIDGEGSFTCSVVEDERLKTGWEVKSYFQIKLHERDKPVLVEIQKSLGVGKISNAGPDAVQLRVQSIKELVPPPLPPTGGRGGGPAGPHRGPPA